MQRTDRFLNNTGTRRTVLTALLTAVLIPLVMLLPARFLTERVAGIQLAEMLSGSDIAVLHHRGIYEGMRLALLPEYPKVFRVLYLALCAVAEGMLLLCTVLSYRRIDRVYYHLDAISSDCARLSDLPDDVHPRLTMCGSEAGSIRCLCEQIQRLANRTHRLTLRLRRSSVSRGQLLSDLTHQLKTSSAVIRLNRDMLDEIPLPEDERARLRGEIDAHLDGMEQLVMQASELTRLGAAAVQYDLSETDLTETCREAAAHIGPLARKKGVQVTVRTEGEIPPLPHDRVWISEGLCNLVKNAVDHAGCTDVEIALTQLPASVRMTVTDNGSGIPVSELPHLFERFHKGNSPESTGLGLAIAQQIFRAHSCELTVHSGEKGTEILCFWHTA